MPGILYLCATPIGNLEDMTFRGIRILLSSDHIPHRPEAKSNILSMIERKKAKEVVKAAV